MDTLFSDRISDVPQSFIREILKVTLDDSIISFAGGLPNRNLFPVKELQQAADSVFTEAGREVLQYANSEGYLPLRQYISERYRIKQQLDIPPENILITTGSQQGLDLLGKIFINNGDGVAIEEPGYLGAIQAFSMYRPLFKGIPVTEEGMDTKRLKSALEENNIKLIYTVPNFQNPAGISYSSTNREEVAQIVSQTQSTLIQDDPYGDLRFTGQAKQNFQSLIPDQCVLLGSFSKTIAPSLRIGWLAAKPQLMEKLLIAKQASDLHTDYLAQRILYQFLADNDLDAHIQTIIRAYGEQKQTMVQSIKQYFPPDVRFTNPEGGMFLWITLPEQLSAMTLFKTALKEKVAFVPGTPFYVDREDTNTLRLNFSCMDNATIETGIQRLGAAIRSLAKEKDNSI
ncbi:PLP-dependent aminotransferase family protein [Desulfogranum marinum]|uniref:aminotransferase-like domain-containing protein n=1 Tax=Desulfogranum marinum TaxID=453220 RepID=UPI0019647D7A|nr:PLP-dependent aminotransferase family protein [Desulfogranum marinum]MBM9510789.1 PLP-dependent aminotransferase family protein [Desulfogranum marinum]